MTSPADLIRARYGTQPFAPPAEIPPALAALLDRRVTRRYRQQDIPGPLLDTILAAAQSAPSKSDLQQYSIVVTRDAAKIAKVADWIGTMPWIRQAPVLLLFCGDMRRGQKTCEAHGRAHANNNMDTFLNTAVDAALAMGMAIAAADAAGLGTCPISYVRSHIEKVGPLFGLPEGVYPVAGLTLGWPEARNEPTPRLPPSVVVHREIYDDAGLDAGLAAYDALRPRQKPRYPEVHGAAPESCTWSENAARQLSVPERFGFRTWLRLRGFALYDAAADNPGGADAEGHSRRTVRPRDAASLILWRIGPHGPELLMGRRHAKHRFMPDVMVFPGGRVDPDDHRLPAATELGATARRMLERRATPARARAIGIAAARELFEETGLVLGERQGDGVAANLAALHYVCRAVTPGGRPIRFNARFLAAEAEAAGGTIAGSGELERLDWYTPEAAHRHHVADITGKVMVEFLDWLEMPPKARNSRPLIVFRGMDNRHQER